MKISFKKFLSYSIAALMITSLSSCVKNDFDVPPAGGEDPVVSGTYITIAALKSLYPVSNNTTAKITNDIYISGVVIADDQSGNFYKEVVLQDSTGGISILLDQSNYYTTYKIGRRVFVKCNGLTVGAYGNLVQIGAGVDNTGSLLRIASTLISQYVLPGSYYHYVTPRTIHIGDITNANIDAYINTYQNTLIKIDTVEFANQDTTFANGPTKQDISLTINDCNGKPIVIRSSGYATFATSTVPAGNGSIVAVLQIYNSFGSNETTDIQIKIRNLSDLTMTEPRCGSNANLIDIAALRAVFTGTPTTGPLDSKIKGIVISDFANGNIDSKNMVLQDGTAGITVRFTSTHSFNLGDEVEVNVSGVELSEFNTLLEVNNTSLGNAVKTGTGSIVPQTVTITQINANVEGYESELVKIMNCTITPPGTYSGNKTITDATGNVVLYTRTGASFAGSNVPTGTVSVTGIQYSYNGAQIIIRNTSDVQ